MARPKSSKQDKGLSDQYLELKKSLMDQFQFTSVMQVPKIERVMVTMGLGEALVNKKAIESGLNELTLITGQKPMKTKARKSIAGFKVRQGQEIGVKVTLRGARMYEFLERLIWIALPRVKDFRGVLSKGFDGHGNYSLGLKEQIIFPEIDYDKIEKIQGLNITIVTSAKNNEQGLALLKGLGMPFRGE